MFFHSELNIKYYSTSNVSLVWLNLINGTKIKKKISNAYSKTDDKWKACRFFFNLIKQKIHLIS